MLSVPSFPFQNKIFHFHLQRSEQQAFVVLRACPLTHDKGHLIRIHCITQYFSIPQSFIFELRRCYYGLLNPDSFGLYDKTWPSAFVANGIRPQLLRFSSFTKKCCSVLHRIVTWQNGTRNRKQGISWLVWEKVREGETTKLWICIKLHKLV